MKTILRKEEGFTLGELLVVIAIMTILVSVSVGTFTGLIGSGRAEAAKFEKMAVQTAIDSYMGITASSTVSARLTAAVITSSDSDAPFNTYLRRLPTTYEYTWLATGSVTQYGAPAGGGGAGDPGGGGGDDLPTPIAQWHLDESGGAAAVDSIGSNHGVVFGATFASGLSGNGLQFTGSEYLQIPEIIPDGEFTIEFWFKPNWNGNDGNAYAIFDATDSPIYFYIGKTSSNQLQWYFESANDADMQISTSSAFITSGNWYHIVATGQFSSSGPHRLYVNNVERGSSTTAVNQKGSLNSPYAGYYTDTYGSPNSGYQGMIDEIAIYDSQLDTTEIQALFDYLDPS